jgi:hypothetical protein
MNAPITGESHANSNPSLVSWGQERVVPNDKWTWVAIEGTDEPTPEHPQGLVLVRYPEGYHAFRTKEGGENDVARTQPESEHRDTNPRNHSRKGTSNLAARAPAFRQRLINLGGILRKVSVEDDDPDYPGHIATLIKPAAAPNWAADHTKTAFRITPGLCSFTAFFEHNTPRDGSYTLFSAHDWLTIGTGANLTIGVAHNRPDTGLLNVNLDGHGNATSVKVYKRGILGKLGITCELDYDDDNWAKISDPGQQALALDVLARTLDIGETWKGLDVKQSTANLYAAMGRLSLTPTDVLVPRS